MNPRRNSKMIAACASLVLVAAACGSDADDAATTDAPAASEAPATDAPVATDAAVATDAPADGPFGPACGAVPTEGEGTFAGMADDPAATAASSESAAVDAGHRRDARPASSTH